MISTCSIYIITLSDGSHNQNGYLTIYKPFIKKGNVEAKIMFGHRL